MKTLLALTTLSLLLLSCGQGEVEKNLEEIKNRFRGKTVTIGHKNRHTEVYTIDENLHYTVQCFGAPIIKDGEVISMKGEEESCLDGDDDLFVHKADKEGKRFIVGLGSHIMDQYPRVAWFSLGAKYNVKVE